MPNDYTEFDALLLRAVADGRSTFHALCCGDLLKQADAMAGEKRGDPQGWRLIERRLQALRKAGKLTFDRAAGWRWAAAMSYREATSVPTCPSCDHAMTSDEMHAHLGQEDLWALAPDEGRTTIKCPGCGVTYHCQGGYRPEYTSALKEEDL